MSFFPSLHVAEIYNLDPPKIYTHILLNMYKNLHLHIIYTNHTHRYVHLHTHTHTKTSMHMKCI